MVLHELTIDITPPIIGKMKVGPFYDLVSLEQHTIFFLSD